MTLVPSVFWSISTLLVTLGDGSSPTASLLPLACAIPAFRLRGARQTLRARRGRCCRRSASCAGRARSLSYLRAPLTAQAGAAIARCTHCAADNLVAPAALERALHRRGAELGKFEEVVRREVAAVQNLAAVSTGAS